jgi:hypothetical protein
MDLKSGGEWLACRALCFESNQLPGAGQATLNSRSVSTFDAWDVLAILFTCGTPRTVQV